MIAIFPSRMDPPHLGHVLTLLRIMDDYDKILVALTEYDFEGEKPTAMPLAERISTLNAVLKYFPKFEIITFKGPFRQRTQFDDLPYFDIVVTASKGVYENVLKHGLKARFLERTPVYRGEFLREAYFKGLEFERKTHKQELLTVPD